MRESIISITIVALLASVADMLSPPNWRKYIRILLGFLIMFTIISPLSALKGIKLPSIEAEEKENSIAFSDNINDTMKYNVEQDIKERIKKEFDVSLSADVILETDSENKIVGVRKITLDAKPSERIENRLKEVYGCENIEYK